MEFIWLIMAFLIYECFHKWDTLRNNNIRHDELYYLVAGIILFVILLVMLSLDTTDIPKIFKFFENQ